jgi:hypothetical protein
MGKLWSIAGNVVLYGFLLWLLYDATFVEWDPWLAAVVAFVLLVAVVVSLVPSLRAPRVSPGVYVEDPPDPGAGGATR